MLLSMRGRLSYPNVILTVGLVFVMTGGAYAAKRYVITSMKQISPKVVHQLRGKVGATGPSGPAGPAGPAGPSGPVGGVGAKGETGKEGPEGQPGATGKEGPQGETGGTGPTGSPWTAGGVLPSGQSEHGTWAYIGNKENGAVGPATVSFAIPLEQAPKGAEFVYAGQKGAECAGSSSAPTAPAGYLCMYDAWEEEFVGQPITGKFVGFNDGEAFGTPGAGKNGAVAIFETVEIGKSPLPYAAAEGTWVVTAE